MVRKHPLAAFCAALLAVAAAPLAAQTYPSKTIRMVVPFPGGGATDAAARSFGQLLAAQLGQSIVAENKTGATGSLGAAEVARAPADGHTILYTSASFALAPLLYKNRQYDPLRDFTPIMLTLTQPVVVVVTPQFPAKSIADLIAHAKANPGAINYGSSGSGGINHLSSSELASRFGVQMTHVAYKGGAPAMVDVMSGQIQMMLAPTGELLPYLQGNRVRPLAIMWSNRLPLLPEVPTMSEAIKQSYADVAVWHGVLVPRATPKEIVARLHTELAKAVQHPELRPKLVAQGNVMLGGSSEDFVALLKAESARWGKVVKDLDLKPFD